MRRINDYSARKRLKAILAISAAAAALVGFVFGFIVFKPSSSKSYINDKLNELMEEEDANYILNRITKDIDVENIRKHLKYLTSLPHVAGTYGDKKTAEYVHNFWLLEGLDETKIIDYDVLLDFTDDIKYNNIEIRNSANELEVRHDIKETIYDLDLDYTNASKPFLALGANGTVETDAVYYVNHCDVNDFEVLVNNSINVKDSIVLCRYGGIFRGNKVKNGQIYGAKAVIIFDDPIRAAPLEARDKVYPNGEFLPPDGVQRGSIYLKEGDPLTPIYPSIDTAYRIQINQSKHLLKIPGQVIGYGLAEEILKMIDSGKSVPIKWKGDMSTNYTFGGKLKNNKKFILNVFNQRRIAKIHDVIGIIEGSIEPDRYVLVGNHRDAWTFGSVDPNTGTSAMLEISRVFMELKRNKIWSPKRTVIFLSWSAEEVGSQGSTEWVEEYLQKLISNAVVYINLDNILKGNYSLEVKASALTFDLLYNITKKINIDDKTTVFDRWIDNSPNVDDTSIPRINPYMGSGSDHIAFLQRAGVPCIDQRFIRNNKDPLFLHMIGSFPLYHSSYETYNLVTKFLDPEFKITRVMSIVAAETIRSLSSSLIIPFNAVRYADQLKKEFIKFLSTNKPTLDSLNISTDNLNTSITNFHVSATKFQNRLKSIDKTNYPIVRRYNDQLKNLERAFLDPSTLEKNGYMHMLYAPSTFNKYGAYSFPTLVESIRFYQKNKTSIALIEEIKYQMSIVIYTIRSAISILKEPTDFDRIV